MSGVTFYEALQKGSFGTVYRARDASLGEVAVKMVRKALVPGSLSQTDVIALKHPNIVQHYRCFLTGDRSFAYVMELAPQCDLFEYSCTGLDDSEVIRLSGDLFAGLEYLHGEGIVHLDIKRENCLIMDGGKLAITDFDFARPRGTPMYGMIGTIESWPPEVAVTSQDRALLARMPAQDAFDIWAAGTVVWEMHTGRSRHVRTSEQLNALMFFKDPFMSGTSQVARIVNAACKRKASDRVLSLRPEDDDEQEDNGGKNDKDHGRVSVMRSHSM